MRVAKIGIKINVVNAKITIGLRGHSTRELVSENIIGKIRLPRVMGVYKELQNGSHALTAQKNSGVRKLLSGRLMTRW
jgi:hypothetical protein